MLVMDDVSQKAQLQSGFSQISKGVNKMKVLLVTIS